MKDMNYWIEIGKMCYLKYEYLVDKLTIHMDKKNVKKKQFND